jgi:hypothetical protein
MLKIDKTKTLILSIKLFHSLEQFDETRRSSSIYEWWQNCWLESCKLDNWQLRNCKSSNKFSTNYATTSGISQMFIFIAFCTIHFTEWFQTRLINSHENNWWKIVHGVRQKMNRFTNKDFQNNSMQLCMQNCIMLRLHCSCHRLIMELELNFDRPCFRKGLLIEAKVLFKSEITFLT